ncbi:FAD binding domain-containing protein [Agromyces sp. Soil535]|uniref:FAD binding domain-containing protein n=1 Tax=Agromyces sp. Soil535 TaxID=1736390 RepID=UPI0006FB5EA7|nr:FAD binding domain-containing protein [Agromyces sp. Soil535]KRE20975.1 FAD-binding molybdopterin dehydrogenase [Agromyces sp. Soil535]
MDLDTITGYRYARSRDDLVLGATERFVAGGTWMFSEPQLDATGLVDLTTMDWPALEVGDHGLRIGATCTIAELAAMPEHERWTAHPLFFQCATALLASFKVWNVATVGGNICCSFAAGAMVSLAVALDGVAVVWTADDGEVRMPVEQFVTGNGTNSLAPGDVLRAVELPDYALCARTGYRKIALAELGRSGAVLTGRVDEDGRSVFGITAATWRPTVLRYDELPDAATLLADAASADGYYTDPLGTADWRREVSGVLLEEIRQELAA